jgi:phytochrome-interacting factor 4
VELLWHNGSVVAQHQAHHRPAPPSDRDRPGTSGLTAEETAAWFPDTLDDPLEKDLYTQLWYNTIADSAPQHEGTFPGPTSHPSPPPPPPIGSSGVESSWAGDICSTFCGSNQVPRMLAGIRGKDAALQSEVPSDAGAHDGTSSSGGSGSNYGGSGLPSDSVHVHKRKGMRRDESDSRSEVFTFVFV